MIQSIIVYGFIIITLYYSFHVNVKKNNNKLYFITSSSYYRNVVCGILIFTFFSAVRWDVGFDQLAYYDEYISILRSGEPIRQDFEYGYIIIQKILAKFNAHFSIYFGLIAFLQLIFTIFYFNKEKYLLPYLVVLIMCGGDYFFWMNGMRQALVSTCFLFTVAITIENRNIFLYITLIILLSFIHASAIILIPLCLLFYLNLESIFIPRWIQLILLVGALVLSQISIWEYFLGFVDKIFTLVGYERFDSAALSNIEEREMNFGPRRIIFLFIDTCLILYSKKLRHAYPSKKFGLTHLLYILFFVIQPLFISSLVFSRVTGYFYIFRILMSSYLLFYLLKLKRTKFNYINAILIICLFILHLLIQIYVDEGNHTGCIKYHFFWD